MEAGELMKIMVSKNDEFRIKNEEFCIKTWNCVLIKNEESCIKNDKFCRSQLV